MTQQLEGQILALDPVKEFMTCPVWFPVRNDHFYMWSLFFNGFLKREMLEASHFKAIN